MYAEVWLGSVCVSPLHEICIFVFTDVRVDLSKGRDRFCWRVTVFIGLCLSMPIDMYVNIQIDVFPKVGLVIAAKGPSSPTREVEWPDTRE